MLKDFVKLETFLIVVREKSFSKASAKLGISQPAVTQQIKYIEEYLDTRIIERKKNGIKLTKDGEKLLTIALRLERAIITAEKEAMKIIKKDVSFNIGASFTIGNYILPNCIANIKDMIKNDVFVKIDTSDNIINALLEKQIDIALIESPVFKDNVVYREWLEDEFVLFSNSKLPRNVKKEDLLSYAWVCREWGSNTRRIINETLDDIGIDCTTFNIKGVVSSSTSVKYTVLKSPVYPENSDRPTTAILSKYVVQDDIDNGLLYEAKIRGCKLKRKLYLAYLKDRKNDAFIDTISSCLMCHRKHLG
ncbi:MAG: LysR substrate-binding domain-containing protein [Wolinella sp.]